MTVVKEMSLKTKIAILVVSAIITYVLFWHF